MNFENKTCEPCNGNSVKLDEQAALKLLKSLDENWAIVDGGRKLVRQFKFKGFAKATAHANLAAFIGDKEGHHPDIQFGWGYCHVTFTTHDLDGLSENDFICAAKLDQVVA